MTTQPTTTLNIETVDLRGRPVGVFHAAMRTLADALRETSRHTPAPANQRVRDRLLADGGGTFSIGQFTVAISMLP